MKSNHTSIKFVIATALCILPYIVCAQSSRSSYFMKTSYARTNLNAALRPDQSYIGIPMLSNIYLDARTNTFNLENLTFPLNGERVTFMHAQIPDDMALSKISDNNYITSSLSVDILSAGFFRGDSYWNFDVRLRLNADVNTPKSLFELLKLGFKEDQTVTHSLADMGVNESSFTEIGATHSRMFLNNNLTIGVRGKVLLGLNYIDMNVNSLDITAGNEFWRAKSEIVLRAAGPGITPRYKENEYHPEQQDFDGFEYGSFNIPGYGLGLDIGAVYDFKDISVNFLKPLKVSYALNDIGFIRWSEKNFTELHSPETEVTITPSDYSIHSDGSSSINDIFDNTIDDIKQAANLKATTTNGGHTTSLRVNMNIGLEYEVWKEKMTAGFLYSARFGNYFTTNEFTLSANYTPKDWLATTLSYSFVNSRFNTFGLAVHLAPSKGVNFFLASDYTIAHISPQWMPTSSRALNLQVGMSVPFGGKRK